MKLEKYRVKGFNRGCSRGQEALWIIVQALLLNTFIPGSFFRIALLRLFGAKIGRNVTIKEKVTIKFPWKLSIGNHSWIGERVWIDNLDQVVIGDNCCISQGVYLCTGNHRWDKEAFNLFLEPVVVENSAWIGAFSIVSPGVTVREGSVLAIGTVATSDTEEWVVTSQYRTFLKKKRKFVDV